MVYIYIYIYICMVDIYIYGIYIWCIYIYIGPKSNGLFIILLLGGWYFGFGVWVLGI